MVVGIPREIKDQEFRVALTPAAVAELVRSGHRVLVEHQAGMGAGYADADYAAAGATLTAEHEAIFEKAGLILKVKEPQPSEYLLLRPRQLLFTYLHLAANRSLTEALRLSGVTALAYETIEVQRRLPLLEPMSEIAGRMSVLVGGYHLARHHGGSGVLLAGVPGVWPGRVTVLGGGTAGFNAARMAVGVGAQVTILEVDNDRMHTLEQLLPQAHTLYSNEGHLQAVLPQTDLLIGAVLVPGARAPKLLRRDLLRLMRPGSVLVDIAIDQGGCAETSHPTTHDAPVFVEEGIIHYCVANMPGAYARTATQALTNATMPYIHLLTDLSLAEACRQAPALLGSINVQYGQITHPAVAKAHGVEPSSPSLEEAPSPPGAPHAPEDKPAPPAPGEPEPEEFR